MLSETEDITLLRLNCHRKICETNENDLEKNLANATETFLLEKIPVFTGGNGEDQLIIEALRLLESGEYEMADVLIISDFIFNRPSPKDIRRVASVKSKGTRFYGLQIYSSSTAYDTILDKEWTV